MRDIKFNLVDEDSKEYVKYDDWLLENSDYDKGLEHLSRFFEFYYEFTPLQYTGLKDTNDVEIYEGDIVKSESGNLYTVEFFDGGFKIVGKDRKLSDIYDLWHYTNNIYLLNVVGNIYENKELLETNKEIYSDFENRTCETCKYNTFETEFYHNCLNEDIIDTDNEDGYWIPKDFGCNKWGEK